MTPDPALTPDPLPASDDGILLTFPKGLLGFQKLTSFRLLEPQDGYPLKFLQSVESEDVSFICIDPASIKQDYEVPLGEEEAESLHLESPEEAMVLTLVVIPENAQHMTTNLAGPLVINVRTRTGFQIVLNSENFPLRFPILPQD
jgi:flagellar assembly factor FliW